ncbi:MAG: hypothetical protein WA673_02815 [Candidatus Acidiferrales bacterium]
MSDSVETEVVIGQQWVRKRRAELALRQQNQRLVIDTLPEPEPGEVNLGDLDATDEPLRIVHEFWRAHQAQYRYRGAPLEFDLGDLS